MLTPIEKYREELERRERIEHRDVLLAIRQLLKLKEGRQLFSYLFKSLEVGELPQPGLNGDVLQELLGFLRAGNSIYKLACEADTETAATLLSEIERKRYDNKYEQHRVENGLDYDERIND